VPRQTAAHVDSPELLGRRLREARQRSGLRLRDLAFDGCSIGYLSHIERGSRIPSLQVVRELARRLGIDEQWLAVGTEPVDPLAEADAALRFDDLEAAERRYSAVLDSAADDRTCARARAGLGQLAFRQDDAQAALVELEAALELDPTLETDDGFADTLGRVYARVGELETAVALFRRRLEAADRSGDALSSLRFSVLLANSLIDLSALQEASQVLADLLTDTVDGDPLSVARLYWSQSRLHAAKQEHAAAARYAAKALELLEATEFTQYRSRAHHLLAYIEIDRGNSGHALELLDKARQLARSGGTPYDIAKLDLEQARALAQLGELEEAAALANRAAAELVRHNPVDLGRCYAELAAVYADAGSADRAIELYELALEYLDHSPNPWFASTNTRLGELHEAAGNHDAAFEAYKRAATAAATADRSRAR
jgi:tetratricopeptide (TPR) repeat protein